LSLLLARFGIPVTLLEAHKDFDRDFRGDTVHASTLEVLDQIGLAEKLHKLPHVKSGEFRLRSGGKDRVAVVYKRLPTKFPYMMIMPQARFLEFVVEEAQRYPAFKLIMGAMAQRLLEDQGVVRGVAFHTDGADREIRAPLVIAADGRFSRLRSLAGLELIPNSAVLEVLWFRVPRLPDDPLKDTGFDLGRNAALVTLTREHEWQLGYVMPKDGHQRLRAKGIEAFHSSVADLIPWVGERVKKIEWKDVHLLSVQGSRLETWHKPGLLLIGDAAHVMLPVGGVGINCAIADAVEAVNVLREPLRRGRVEPKELVEVQRRRQRLTRIIQAFQAGNANGMLRAMAAGTLSMPLMMRIVLGLPLLRDLPGRVAALGVRRVLLEDAAGGVAPQVPRLRES